MAPTAAERSTLPRVLFLCTGNSCRSQMAEALAAHFAGERWAAFSAGTRPAGFVHLMALAALAEIGIQHAGVSKPVEVFRQQPFDLVVTVCDAAAEDCPLWLGQGRVVHVSFPDPAKAEGSPEERMSAFRRVRDDMRARLLPLLLVDPY